MANEYFGTGTVTWFVSFVVAMRAVAVVDLVVDLGDFDIVVGLVGIDIDLLEGDVFVDLLVLDLGLDLDPDLHLYFVVYLSPG